MDETNQIKRRKKQDKSKKSRLVIRNLSFKCTEEDIRKIFSSYGQIVDISLPRKENGQIKGFAFLSFDNVKSSLKAIKYINGTKHLNRELAIDFAVPKNIYTQVNNENNEKEEEHSNIDEEEIDEQDIDEEDNDEEDNENNNEDDENEDEDEDNYSTNKKKPRRQNDVKEGKTIFIRNLDIETEEDSVNELFSSFGSLEYCKICYDEFTGKSKGSAFVKYRKKEDADKCLEEASIPENPKFILNGKHLNVTQAVSRHQLEEIKLSQHQKHKDKRNLYLAKEGLIYPDSPAAKGVSQSDLKKRLMLEEKKRVLLQNLHNFISDRRLCIHNLPPSFDDDKLKKLFLSAVNDKSAKILWVKVMRNRNKSNGKFGSSKGFGFAEFEEHKHALKALRHLNNNPQIFTADRRPIVEFSIENKVALNRKKFRLMKQQKLKNEEIIKNIKFSTNSTKAEDEEQKSFCGVTAKPFQKNEKVVRPKVNRKLREQQNKVKTLKRQVKQNAKIKDTQSTIQKKAQKKKMVEEDEFEIKYLKRKYNFIDESNDNNKVPKVLCLNKKRKWFMQ